MSTLRTAILPALDTIRSIGGLLGLRVVNVYVRRDTWSGLRPGDGTVTKGTPVQFVNTMPDGSVYPVRVTQVSRQDIISSGGQYVDGDFKVGPITPPYPPNLFGQSGGFDDTTIDPTPTASPAQAIEVVWIMSSTIGTFGLPAIGATAKKVGEEATSLHTFVFLRRLGAYPP